MNKKKLLLASIASLSILLTGCDVDSDSSSIPSSDASSSSSGSSDSGSSSSSSVVPVIKQWTDEQKSLLITYCGSILPYPSCLEGDVEFRELNNDGSKYLVILNKSDSFTLKAYNSSLKENGWTVIKDQKGNEYQSYQGLSYYEFTKKGDENGFELMYYHDEVTLNEETALYNVIICHNDFSVEKRKETGWNASDSEAIEYVTTRDIPYIALGNDYSLYNTNEDTLVIYDYLAEDLTDEYVSLLEEDGYIYSTVLTYRNNAKSLIKYFSDGSQIEIAIRYYQGNNIYVYYTPKVTAYSSWPSEFLSALETNTGITIPTFPVASGGNYLTYKKHDTYYLYSVDLSSSYNYESYVSNVTSELFSWEEKLSVQAYILTDDEYNNTGFIMYLKESTPTSSFSSSWPKEDILSSLKESISVEGVDIPSLDLSTLGISHDVKYIKVTQKDYDDYYAYYLALFLAQYSDIMSKEDIEELARDYANLKVKKGVKVSVYDEKCDVQVDAVTRYKVNEAYKNALYQAGWYLVPDSSGSKYEDPTGKILIEVRNTPYGDYGYTSISISKGSGEAHTPQLEFGKKNYELQSGGKLTLTLNKNMLPNDVEYSSSDTSIATVDSSGVVTASSSAEAGKEVTITATSSDINGNTYTATCTVTITKAINYSTVLDDVSSLLVAAGYDSSTFTREDIVNVSKKVTGERLTVNMGSEKTKDEIKALVKDSLIPANFVSSKWDSVTNDDAYISNWKSDNGFNIKAAKTSSDLECLYCYRQMDSTRLTLRYYVYTASNGDIILYIESSNY